MYFPVADIEIAWYIPVIATSVISFVSSMAGFSGAFLILPFQILGLGYTAPSVSATNQVYNIAAVPASLYRYKKEKRFYKPLCMDLFIGVIPAVLLGTLVRSFLLDDHATFRIYTAILLFCLSCLMLRQVLKKSEKIKLKDPYSLKHIANENGIVSFSFDGKEYCYPRTHISLISGIFTFFGSIYGIGGGVFVAPFLVSYFKLPVYVTAAPMLFVSFFSSVLAVSFFLIFGLIFPENKLMPDFMLGFLLSLGGIIGMNFGTMMQKKVSTQRLNILIFALLLFASFITIEPILESYLGL